MSALSDVVTALDRAGCKPTQHGNGSYTAFCPVHEADGGGHKPSLAVSTGDKVDVVMNCHAGCDRPAILNALGLESGKASNSQRRIVASYPYSDASGATVFEKVRYEPKDFRIRYRDASGAEVWKLPRVEPPLYNLPDVLTAKEHGRPICIVEGEKDADRLAGLFMVATCNFEGAAKGSQKAKWRPLAGKGRRFRLAEPGPHDRRTPNAHSERHGIPPGRRWRGATGTTKAHAVYLDSWLHAGEKRVRYADLDTAGHFAGYRALPAVREAEKR